MKFCNKCGVELVLGENWPTYLAKNWQNTCRTCNKRLHQKQHEENIEAVRQYHREDYEANKVVRRDQHCEYMREYNGRHWRESEEHRQNQLDANRRYRARKLNNGLVEVIDKRAIWGRDFGHCRIKLVCNGVFVPFDEMHLDHVIPISRGGTHTWNNVQTGCPSCNCTKKDRTLEELGLVRR